MSGMPAELAESASLSARPGEQLHQHSSGRKHDCLWNMADILFGIGEKLMSVLKAKHCKQILSLFTETQL